MGDPSYSIRRTLLIIHKFLHPYYYILVVLVVLNMIPGVLLGLRPLFLAPALGQIIPGEVEPAENFFDLSLDNIGASLLYWLDADYNQLGAVFFWSAALYLVTTCLIALISTAASMIAISTRMKILSEMINSLHSHLLHLPLGFYVKQKSGELISRFTSDAVIASRSMEIVVRGCVQSLVQIIVYMAILLKTDAELAVKVLCLGLIHLVITRLLGKITRESAVGTYDSIASLTNALQESFLGVRVIKTFSAELYETIRVDSIAQKMREKMHRFQLIRFLETPIRLLTDGVIVSCIIYLAYQEITSGQRSMAGVAIFFYLASQLITPISEFSKHLVSAYGVQASLLRLTEFFDLKNDLPDGDQAAVSFEDTLICRDMSFSYEIDRIALQNISLEIKKGSIVAIVGSSGSGKSTLLDLLLRLYDPDSGSILLDKKDIREFKQKQYRNLFGVVSQDCFLFNGTIQDNILLGRSFDREILNDALQIANLDDFIDSLPQKLDTQVGDRGIKLSGGQKQRISIARAIYGKPEILILDEATSSLDSESEAQVQIAINGALSGYTGIVVAHRLSTVINADKIVVIDQGKIVDIGSHIELITSCQTYKNFYDKQFSNH